MKFYEKVSYLDEDSWNAAVVNMEPLLLQLSEISKELDLEFECHKRWPMIELKQIKSEVMSSFKFSLNKDYLEDGLMFFQLIYCQFKKKDSAYMSIGDVSVLSSYNMKDMADSDEVASDVRNKIETKMMK